MTTDEYKKVIKLLEFMAHAAYKSGQEDARKDKSLIEKDFVMKPRERMQIFNGFKVR